MRIFMMMALTFVFFTAPVWAEEKAKESKEEGKAAEEVVVDVKNPHLEKVKEKASALANSLTREQAQSLGIIRQNFGVIRSVGVARESVNDAVGQCAKNNPDLKDDINTRFKNWDKEIGGALEAQEKLLQGSINKDRFPEPKKVKDYLDTIDKAAEFADDQIEKKIITTEEACKNLMNSMDETQSVILELVTALKWPVDVTVEDTEDSEAEGSTP